MAIDTPARIAVLGAGPIGLEAALYARYLGYDVDLYERGRVADHVLRWGHVRMFTPFSQNRSPLGLAALRAQDPAWQPPADDAFLTGREYAERYLLPLAESDLLAGAIHERTEVLAIGRDGPLKHELATELETRGETDFRILLRSSDGQRHAPEHCAAADAVIDATGTYGRPCWIGKGGIPAIGELASQEHIEYGLPDVLGTEHGRYAGRNILLVGEGDSAVTTLVALAELAAQTPDTWITWITRDGPEAGAIDVLSPAEGGLSPQARLWQRARHLAADDADHVTHQPTTMVESIQWHADLKRFAVRFAGDPEEELEFDRVIANVGYLGHHELYAALQVDRNGVTGAPRTTTPGGLVTTEPDFYVLGVKSHGCDSSFRIAAGLAQVRALFAIIGDRPDLDLYATMSHLAGETKS